MALTQRRRRPPPNHPVYGQMTKQGWIADQLISGAILNVMTAGASAGKSGVYAGRVIKAAKVGKHAGKAIGGSGSSDHLYFITARLPALATFIRAFDLRGAFFFTSLMIFDFAFAVFAFAIRASCVLFRTTSPARSL